MSEAGMSGTGMSEARLYRVALPMRIGFDHPAARRSTSDSLVLRLESDGASGIGECAPRAYVTGETSDGVVAALRRIPMEKLFERIRSLPPAELLGQAARGRLRGDVRHRRRQQPDLSAGDGRTRSDRAPARRRRRGTASRSRPSRSRPARVPAGLPGTRSEYRRRGVPGLPGTVPLREDQGVRRHRAGRPYGDRDPGPARRRRPPHGRRQYELDGGERGGERPCGCAPAGWTRSRSRCPGGPGTGCARCAAPPVSASCWTSRCARWTTPVPRSRRRRATRSMSGSPRTAVC